MNTPIFLIRIVIKISTHSSPVIWYYVPDTVLLSSVRIETDLTDVADSSRKKVIRYQDMVMCVRYGRTPSAFTE